MSAPNTEERRQAISAVASLQHASSDVHDLLLQLNTTAASHWLTLFDQCQDEAQVRLLGDGLMAAQYAAAAVQEQHTTDQRVLQEAARLAAEEAARRAVQEYAAAHPAAGRTQTTLPQEVPLPSDNDDDLIAPTILTLRSRSLRDLGPGPKYDGSRPKAAARQWLRACQEHFEMEEALVHVRSTSYQRVLLAAAWLTGTARKAWESASLAHRTDPRLNILPTDWPSFEQWILSRFDEPHARERLCDDFLSIRQRGDVQTYCADFMIAYQLSGMTIDDDGLRQHLIQHLKPAIRQEWKRLQTKPTTWDGMLSELLRLEDVVASSPNSRSSRYDVSSTPLTTSNGGDAMDLDTINAIAQRPNPPRKGTAAWKAWCRNHNACFTCGSTRHLARDCSSGPTGSQAGGGGNRNARHRRGGGRGGNTARRTERYGNQDEQEN